MTAVFRNPIFNHLGSVDVEIEHPTLGWIPHTASSDDVSEEGRDLYQVIISAGGIAPYEPPPPSPVTPDDVDAERDRRIAAGFTFAGVFYQTRPEDRENIAGASTAALAAIVSGAQPGDLRWHGEGSDFAWIAADNSTHTMDAQTMFAFGQAAMAHKTRHIFAARDLKNMDPIPLDFADNNYWP